MDPATTNKILAAGVAAPSGDNSQPWTFSVGRDSITVRYHTERDHPILNVEGRGTLLATGALIENICIAAKNEGFATLVRDVNTESASILLEFSPAAMGHPRAASIFQRHSNRHPYHPDIPPEALQALSVEPEPHCRIAVVSDKTAVRNIARAATVMEEAALKTEKIHREFFKSIIWSDEANQRGESGLFIKTTELPPPVRGLFRLIRHWSIMRVFNALGLPKLAAKANEGVYARSAACVAVLLDRYLAQDFIAAGRCMQRVWLEATHQGLAAQPLAGLLYLAEHIERTDDPHIASDLKRRALEARVQLEGIFGTAPNSIAIILRVGLPLRPASARSQRKAPVIT